MTVVVVPSVTVGSIPIVGHVYKQKGVNGFAICCQWIFNLAPFCCDSLEATVVKLGMTSGMKGKTFIVQGFGNVGRHTMDYIDGAGGKVVAIAEADGSLVDESGNGLDIRAAKAYHKKGTMTGFLGAQTVTMYSSCSTNKMGLFSIFIC